MATPPGVYLPTDEEASTPYRHVRCWGCGGFCRPFAPVRGRFCRCDRDARRQEQIHEERRELYERHCEPLVLAITDAEVRRSIALLIWRLLELQAQWRVGSAMRGTE